MMRRAPIPHAECGSARVCSRRKGWLRLVHALVLLADAAVALTLIALPSTAQDPSIFAGARGPRNPRSPRSRAASSGRRRRSISAQPLYLQADQLLYDTKNNRVIAQGNVEIYYNNYILTADQVVYDQAVNKLIAEGNAQLKDPNGGITRADRFEALDDFRDAFIQSLSVVTADDTRIAAERADPPRGQHHRVRARQVHALQERPRHAAAVVHRRRPHHSRPACRHHHLPGCAVRAVRRAGALPALLPAPRPLGEASHRLPDAGVQQLERARFWLPHALLFCPGARTTISPSIPATGPTTACCGRATGAIGWPTAQYSVSIAAIDQGRDGTAAGQRPGTGAGAGRSRPRANSRSRPGGVSDGTSRPRATRASAASTSSTRFCRPTASTRSICRA